MDQQPGNQRRGISRRDLLKKGAALGGAVVWVTPAVQTLGMGRAFASTASPAERFSYAALDVRCDSGLKGVKWEFDGGGFWAEPGQTPGCGWTHEGQIMDGDAVPGLGSLVVQHLGGGSYQIVVGCYIAGGVVKAGKDDCYLVVPGGQFVVNGA